MYCNYCGNQITDNSVFCNYCGKSTGIKHGGDELTDLVAAARNGDQNAIASLYEKTYNKVFYTIKSMIKDEDDVFDILQDSYIKAFSHLDKFQGNTKFLPWVKQIAANTARDWLKKKKPMLFSEMVMDDAEDSPIEEQFVDERSDSIPEQVIDQNETARLIREIIEDLPEDQRAVIGMFYYEELSVKDIAAAMGTSESAVKSRLLYGRRKIEDKVLELEKKGTKLYGLAPIPFLLMLFRNQNAHAAELPNGQIIQNVLQNSSNISSTSSAAGTGASASSTAGNALGGAKAAGAAASVISSLGAVKVVLLSIAAVAVVAAGFFGTAAIDSYFDANLSGTAEEENRDGNDADFEEGTDIQNVEERSPLDEALEQYRMIISRADSYDYYAESNRRTVGYQYALVQMNSADTVPTLLLKQMAVEADTGYGDHQYVRIFKYDPDSAAVRQPAESIYEGSASVGGSGVFISMADDGNGLYVIGYHTRTGVSDKERVTLNGDSLVRDEFKSDYDLIEIEWYDIGDTSALNNWAAPKSGGAEQSKPSYAEDTLPTDGDRIVLTGKVGAYSYDEVLELQGISDPNPYPNNPDRRRTYWLIVLDAPQTLSAMVYDPPDDYLQSGKVTMFLVDNVEQYEGEHVIFSYDPDNAEWPGDTSLPLGQPSADGVHILKILS